MLKLINYINEALIKKDTKLDTNIDIKMLSKSFDNIDDLINALNAYFSARIEKPIKLINKPTKFKSLYWNEYVTVDKYFNIYFIPTSLSFKHILRGGIKNNSLIIQYGSKYKSSYKWGSITYQGYEFGKGQKFLSWLYEIYKPNSTVINLFNGKGNI